MGYYKFNLDKIDKMVIAGLCIIMTFFCVFNTFCYASIEEIPDGYNKVTTDVYLSNVSIGSIRFVSTPGSTVYRVKLDYGANYIMINTPHYLNYFLSNSEDYSVGDDVDVPINQLGADTTTYIYTNGDFKYLYFSKFADNDVSIYTNANKMNSAITGLVDMLNPTSFWEVFETAIPYVGVVALASFGFYLIFHNVKEISKGREKMN